MSSAYWAADAIATNIEAINDRRHAAAALTRAEQYHRGTIAQLAAALNAIRELDSSHALNHQVVLDVIDHDGECTDTFRQAWRLEHDPAQILTALKEQFEKMRTAKLAEVRLMLIRKKRRGWFWRRYDAFLFGKVVHLTMQEAVAAKSRAISFVTTSKFGDDLNTI